MSAIISECGRYRYRLDRTLRRDGPVFAYFGVNGSTANADKDDQTTRKWIGFTSRNGGSRYIVGNPFAYRATDVRELAEINDPVGPDNARYLAEIVAEADILVPCWGNESKVPHRLRHHFSSLSRAILASKKTVRVFGLTRWGHPKHPLMLGYDTPLVEWSRNDDGR